MIPHEGVAVVVLVVLVVSETIVLVDAGDDGDLVALAPPPRAVDMTTSVVDVDVLLLLLPLSPLAVRRRSAMLGGLLDRAPG